MAKKKTKPSETLKKQEEDPADKVQLHKVEEVADKEAGESSHQNEDEEMTSDEVLKSLSEKFEALYPMVRSWWTDKRLKKQSAMQLTTGERENIKKVEAVVESDSLTQGHKFPASTLWANISASRQSINEIKDMPSGPDKATKLQKLISHIDMTLETAERAGCSVPPMVQGRMTNVYTEVCKSTKETKIALINSDHLLPIVLQASEEEKDLASKKRQYLDILVTANHDDEALSKALKEIEGMDSKTIGMLTDLQKARNQPSWEHESEALHALLTIRGLLTDGPHPTELDPLEGQELFKNTCLFLLRGPQADGNSETAPAAKKKSGKKKMVRYADDQEDTEGTGDSADSADSEDSEDSEDSDDSDDSDDSEGVRGNAVPSTEKALFVTPNPRNKYGENVKTVGWLRKGRGEKYLNRLGPRNAAIYRIDKFADSETYEDNRPEHECINDRLNRYGDVPGAKGKPKWRNVLGIYGVAWAVPRGSDGLHLLDPDLKDDDERRTETYVLLKWDLDGEIKKAWETRACLRIRWGEEEADFAIYEAALEAQRRHDEIYESKRDAQSRSPSVGLLESARRRRQRSGTSRAKTPRRKTTPKFDDSETESSSDTSDDDEGQWSVPKRKSRATSSKARTRSKPEKKREDQLVGLMKNLSSKKQKKMLKMLTEGLSQLAV